MLKCQQLLSSKLNTTFERLKARKFFICWYFSFYEQLCYGGINAKVFRSSIAFAIAVVVRSCFSSFEYIISLHTVHAGAERNVCNSVVSTETPQNFHQSISNAAPCVQTSTLTSAPPKSSPTRPTQPLAQPFAQMRDRCKYQVSSTGSNILEVYIIYLHVVSVHERSGKTLKMCNLI